MKTRAVVVVAALALAGCGSDEAAQSGTTVSETVQTTTAPADGVRIEHGWARASAAGQTTGAIYFDLTSPIDDRLLDVSVPATVAAAAQVHEVVPADMGGDDTMDDMGGDDTMNDMGAMVMQQVQGGLVLAAGATVSFEPGSYHVMMLDLAEPLVVGGSIELTLNFENAGSQTITVPVAETAP